MIARKHESLERARFPDGVDKRRFRVSFAELGVSAKKINTPAGTVDTAKKYRVPVWNRVFAFRAKRFTRLRKYASFSSEHRLFLSRDTVMGGQ